MPVAQHDQIFFVLAGHNPGQAHRTDTNKFGHLVYQVMADYQDRWQTAERSEAKSSPHEQPKMTDAEFLAAEDFVISLADFRQPFDKTARVTR